MRLSQHKGRRLKGVFTPFCKGLGIYCNGFLGCGDLGPHKCTLSDLSHSIKEVEIVEGETPISIHRGIDACLAFYPAYLIGKCIGQGREIEESALAILCIKALKRRERDCGEVRSRNFVFSIFSKGGYKVRTTRSSQSLSFFSLEPLHTK